MSAGQQDRAAVEPVGLSAGEPDLTAVQLAVLSGIGRDEPLWEVAVECGVNLREVVGWLDGDPAFRSAVDQLRRQKHEDALLEMERLRLPAIVALGELLESSGVPADVKLRAAQFVLDRTEVPPDLREVWRGWDGRGETQRRLKLIEPKG